MHAPGLAALVTARHLLGRITVRYDRAMDHEKAPSEAGPTLVAASDEEGAYAAASQCSGS